MFTEERWKAISGFEGVYEVSDHGRVRSLDRELTMIWKGKEVRKFRNGKMMKPMIKASYQVYHLRDEVNSLNKWITGHRLVAIHFLPNPNNLPVIDHKDDNKLNNHHLNLQWCSNSFNTKKARDQGKFMSGNDRVLNPLTIEKVREVERLLGEGVSVIKITKLVDVSQRSIGRIKNKQHKLCSINIK